MTDRYSKAATEFWKGLYSDIAKVIGSTFPFKGYLVSANQAPLVTVAGLGQAADQLAAPIPLIRPGWPEPSGGDEIIVLPLGNGQFVALGPTWQNYADINFLASPLVFQESPTAGERARLVLEGTSVIDADEGFIRAVKLVAGTPSDGSFTTETPIDGVAAIDTVSKSLFIRYGGQWLRAMARMGTVHSESFHTTSISTSSTSLVTGVGMNCLTPPAAGGTYKVTAIGLAHLFANTGGDNVDLAVAINGNNGPTTRVRIPGGTEPTVSASHTATGVGAGTNNTIDLKYAAPASAVNMKDPQLICIVQSE